MLLKPRRNPSRPRCPTPGGGTLQVALFPTELGWMAAAGRDGVLVELTFGHAWPREATSALRAAGVPPVVEDWDRGLVARLQAYARGEAVDFRDVPIELGAATEFQRAVVERCRQVPYGQTLTYGDLAARAGRPRAARAVGNIMAANLTPLVVPCHRVVPASGRLGNYSAPGGTRMKLRLLEAEAADGPAAVHDHIQPATNQSSLTRHKRPLPR